MICGCVLIKICHMENVMAEEIVDLLDETGKKLGKIKKSLAHQNGAWHRVVHIWILNSKGQLLIQKRSKEKSLDRKSVV